MDANFILSKDLSFENKNEHEDEKFFPVFSLAVSFLLFSAKKF